VLCPSCELAAPSSCEAHLAEDEKWTNAFLRAALFSLCRGATGARLEFKSSLKLFLLLASLLYLISFLELS